jgi:DNA polymerase-3 subunit epsilon
MTNLEKPNNDVEDTILLRRLRPVSPTPRRDMPGVRLGVVVDVETTGLGASEIIEVAAIPFSYDPLEGTVLAVHEPFDRLREPSAPIPAEITELTGITNAMVAGKRIDLDELRDFLAPASMFVAHNARFDRPQLETLCPEAFVTKPWACSIEDAAWAAEGIESPKLAFIAMNFGFFYERHRATSDCLAVIEILGRKAPKSEKTVLAKVLESARRGRVRVRAFGTRYDEKDALRARGYRWDPGSGAAGKNWFVDLPDMAAAERERAYLNEGVFALATRVTITRLTALDRFSRRV